MFLTSLLLSHLVSTSTLNATQIQADIQAAYSAGKHSYTLPAGTFNVTNAASGSFFVSLGNMTNFTINGTGTTFILKDATKGGFYFGACSAVSLIGLRMIHDPVPFTQATIVGVDPNDAWIDVNVMAGYPDWVHNPTVLPESSVGDVFDQTTRQWKTGTIDAYFNNVTPLGGSKFRINVSNPYTQQSIKPGDFLICRGNVVEDILLDHCEKMNVQGVQIESSTGFCVHESDGNGGNHYTFMLTYGPAPTGGTVRPLISSNADAFHSNATRHGPTVEHCFFEGMPDDGANIHGNYADTVAIQGNTLIVNTLWGDLPVQPGDPLIFYSSTDVPLRLTANVVSATPLPDYKPAKPSTLPAFQNVSNFWQITLDRSLNLVQDNLVAMPNAEGDGFIFRSNTIKNNRARGILIKASDGLVDSNSIDGSTIAGIVVSPEIAGGMESDFTHSLIIRNNTVHHVAYQAIGPWINQVGAISVTADPGAGIGHQGLSIINNTIELQDGINMLLTNLNDALIQGNQFVQPMQHTSVRGATYRFNPNAVIDLENDRDLRFIGNTFVKPGPAMNEKLHIGVNVSGITQK